MAGPDAMLDDEDALLGWLAKGRAYAESLPPKEAGKKAAAKTTAKAKAAPAGKAKVPARAAKKPPRSRSTR